MPFDASPDLQASSCDAEWTPFLLQTSLLFVTILSLLKRYSDFGLGLSRLNRHVLPRTQEHPCSLLYPRPDVRSFEYTIDDTGVNQR